MKTSEQIRAYLLDAVDHALRRPMMYHSSPESMEECFALIDDLLAFMAGDAHSPYTEYLVEQGFGAMRFTTRLPGAGQAEGDRFRAFAQFFAAYLMASPHYQRSTRPDSERTDHA